MFAILMISHAAFSVPQHSGSEQGVMILITRLDEFAPEQPSLTSSVIPWMERIFGDYPSVEVHLLDMAVPPGKRPNTDFLESLPSGSFVVISGYCTVEEENVFCNLNFDIVTNAAAPGHSEPVLYSSAEFQLGLSELAEPEAPNIVAFMGYSSLSSIYYQRGEMPPAGHTGYYAMARSEGVPEEYVFEIVLLLEEILEEADNLNAIVNLDDAIEQEPENGKLYLSRAIINAHLGNYDAMILDTDTAIALDATDTETAVAYVAGILELHSIVRRDYNNGADISPEMFTRMEGYLDEALLISNRAIELDSGNADLFYNRAGVYGYRTEWPSAIEDLTAAIELNPGFAEAYNNRGNINVEMSFLEEGISDFSRAIELSPDSVSYYEDRAYAYQHSGESENARTDLRTAEEIRAQELDDLRDQYPLQN
jgi:tetratricopeptide (TPR) repeat protein